MANLIERQISLEGQRNVIVKWTGVLDTSNFALRPALALGDCLYNDPQNRLVGLRLMKAEWTIGRDLQLILAWSGTVPQQMAPLAGRGCIESRGGFAPDRTRTGYTGGIDLSSRDYTPGTTAIFTVVLEFIKLYASR